MHHFAISVRRTFFHLEISLGIVVLITLCVPCVCLALLVTPSSQGIIHIILVTGNLFQPGLSVIIFQRRSDSARESRGECCSHAGQPWTPQSPGSRAERRRAEGSVCGQPTCLITGELDSTV